MSKGRPSENEQGMSGFRWWFLGCSVTKQQAEKVLSHRVSVVKVADLTKVEVKGQHSPPSKKILTQSK